MNTQRIFTRAQCFDSSGRTLVSWGIGGHSIDDTDPTRNWQVETVTIATIPEAEDFYAKLGAAIAEARAVRAKVDAARTMVTAPGDTTEEQPL